MSLVLGPGKHLALRSSTNVNLKHCCWLFSGVDAAVGTCRNRGFLAGRERMVLPFSGNLLTLTGQLLFGGVLWRKETEFANNFSWLAVELFQAVKSVTYFLTDFFLSWCGFQLDL